MLHSREKEKKFFLNTAFESMKANRMSNKASGEG